jgi:hypothetical protein
MRYIKASQPEEFFKWKIGDRKHDILCKVSIPKRVKIHSTVGDIYP